MTLLIVVRFTCHLIFHVVTGNPATERYANVEIIRSSEGITSERKPGQDVSP